jgi:hypothetical protein
LVDVEDVAYRDQGHPRRIEVSRLGDLLVVQRSVATLDATLLQQLGNGCSMDSKLLGHLLQGGAAEVGVNHPIDPGSLQSAEHTPWGSRNRRFGSRGDDRKDLTEPFSLVRGVQITSHYLHKNALVRGRFWRASEAIPRWGI